MSGLIFGQGRRVVAAWIRAAGLSADYRDYYYFLQSVGRHWPELGRRVMVLVLQQALRDQQRVLLAIDDSPTKRYGPRVQGGSAGELQRVTEALDRLPLWSGKIEASQ